MRNTNTYQPRQASACRIKQLVALCSLSVVLSSAHVLSAQAADILPPSLGNVPLGLRAINRHAPLDRNSLVGYLGSPTAVLVDAIEKDGKMALAGMGVLQRPPFAGAALIPLGKNQYMPQWAQSIVFPATTDQVEWVYNRGTYAMGFEVTRSGIVDGIVVSGFKGGHTQLLMQDNYQPVDLGESLSALSKDWGRADVTNTYPEHAAKNSAASPKEAPKTLVMTYKIEDQESYWVTMTIRHNAIVRISLIYGPERERTDAFPKPRPFVIN